MLLTPITRFIFFHEDQGRFSIHLIGVCGGMSTASSSDRFFFGVLSTCDLNTGGDCSTLFFKFIAHSFKVDIKNTEQ